MDAVATPTETVRCTFEYSTFTSTDSSFSVCKYKNCENKKLFYAVGESLPKQRKLVYLLTGCWETNRKYNNRQFRVLYSEVPKVSDKDSVIAYLQSLHCNIGAKKAAEVYKKFQGRTWEILETDPHRLAEIPGISTKIVSNLIRALKENAQNKGIIQIFAAANIQISAEQVKAIIEQFGGNAIETLKENPYVVSRLRKISFEKCDAVALSLGFPKNHPYRLESGIFYTFEMAALRGHVCVPKVMFVEAMAERLEVSRSECESAINKAWTDGKIKGANGFLFSTESYNQEQAIAANLVRLMKSGSEVLGSVDPIIEEYEKQNFPLADSQKEAIRNVFKHQVNIITGGPGTGKTTVTKAVLYVHKMVYGEASEPILLAPTGRASRRLSETTGCFASTIHSAVGYKMKRNKDDEAEASDGPLEGNLVIVDESSMMDQQIASILLEKIKTGSKVVFVGDPDQLPSVGCGNVLLDMIMSNVIPTTKLTVIFRQAGENPIVHNAHAINEGSSDFLYSRSFRFIETSTEQEAFEAAEKLYVRCVNAYGIDNVVLLNPQRNNTELSVDKFNKSLQNIINPRREGELVLPVGQVEFRIGDKVMQLKNTDEARNGDIGVVKDIVRRPNEKNMEQWSYFVQIEWNDSGQVFEYAPDELRNIDLAYCSTVHKAQGQEYDTVIMVVSKAHPAMLKRNLVYTGITRAKVNVALIGEKDALDMAIANNKCEERYTLLAPRLIKLMAS